MQIRRCRRVLHFDSRLLVLIFVRVPARGGFRHHLGPWQAKSIPRLRGERVLVELKGVRSVVFILKKEACFGTATKNVRY